MRCLFVKKIFWLPGRGPVPRRRFNSVISLWMEFFQLWDDDGVGCSNPAFLYEVLYEDEEGYEPERVSKNRFRAICGREKRCRSLKRGRSLRRKAELLLLSVGFWSGWLYTAVRSWFDFFWPHERRGKTGLNSDVNFLCGFLYSLFNTFHSLYNMIFA